MKNATITFPSNLNFEIQDSLVAFLTEKFPGIAFQISNVPDTNEPQVLMLSGDDGEFGVIDGDKGSAVAGIAQSIAISLKKEYRRSLEQPDRSVSDGKAT